MIISVELGAPVTGVACWAKADVNKIPSPQSLVLKRLAPFKTSVSVAREYSQSGRESNGGKSHPQ
jgi:hypothetical protein